MADGVKWIKITTDMFSNRKIRQIEVLPDGDALIVIWVRLLLLAGTINDSGRIYLTPEIPYTDQMLAAEFGKPISTVQMALSVFQKFGMIEITDEIINISNWSKYQNTDGLEKIREQNRLRKQKQREKERALIEDHGTSRDSHVTVTHLDKDIDKDTDLDTEKEREKDLKNRKKNTKKKAAASALDDADLAIRDALEAFIDNRKKLRKPMTDRAVEMLLKRLDTLAPDDYETQRKMLENATLNGWQNVYPLKEEKKRPAQSGEEYLMRLARGEEE